MFGINIKQSALQQELLAMGIKKSVVQASEQEKVLARVNVIYKAMGQQGAIGDAERTAGSLTNTMRRLKDAFVDMGVEIGNIFVPAARDAAAYLTEIVKGLKNIDPVLAAQIKDWTIFSGILAGAVIILPKLVGGLIAIAGVLGGPGFALLLGAGGLGTLFASLFLTATARGQTLNETLREMLGLLTDQEKAIRAIKDLEEELARVRGESKASAAGAAEEDPLSLKGVYQAARAGAGGEFESRIEKATTAAVKARKALASEEARYETMPKINKMSAFPGVFGTESRQMAAEARLRLAQQNVRTSESILGRLQDEQEAAMEAAGTKAGDAFLEGIEKANIRSMLTGGGPGGIGEKGFWQGVGMRGAEAEQMVGADRFRQMLQDMPQEFENFWSRLTRTTLPGMVTGANRLQRGLMDLGKDRTPPGRISSGQMQLSQVQNWIQQQMDQKPPKIDVERNKLLATLTELIPQALREGLAQAGVLR
jgi:hypothetical protein